MNLRDQLGENIKQAQKSGEAHRLLTLRGLSAQIHNQEIELGHPLTDSEVVEVFQKEAKKRREAIGLYEQGQRPDLAEKERDELEIIQNYLPAGATEAEVEAVVDKVIRGGARDFGSAMKLAMQELKGRADGKMVGEAVKRKLG